MDTKTLIFFVYFTCGFPTKHGFHFQKQLNYLHLEKYSQICNPMSVENSPWAFWTFAFFVNRGNGNFSFGRNLNQSPQYWHSYNKTNSVCPYHLFLFTSPHGIGAWELAQENTGTFGTSIATSNRLSVSCLLPASMNERQTNMLACK